MLAQGQDGPGPPKKPKKGHRDNPLQVLKCARSLFTSHLLLQSKSKVLFPVLMLILPLQIN